MIDWKKLATEIAEVVIQYDKTKDRDFRELSTAQAKQIERVADLEEKATEKFLEWHTSTNKKNSEKLYAEYLDLVRLTNKELGVFDERSNDEYDKQIYQDKK